MKKIEFVLNEEYINAIKGYGKDYRFSLEDRSIDGESDYCDCKTANEVIEELKKFVSDKEFNPDDYECLAVLVYDANIDDKDNWGERKDEYYFI